MKIIHYIREHGIKYVLEIIWKYKIDICIQKCLLFFFRKKNLKDIIVIESHNDFDCNGGAFYNYLIKYGYNKKYKIVWLLKNRKNIPNKLPPNVECFPLFTPNIKKDYYCVLAKFFTYDNTSVKKMRDDQKMIYFRHGAGGLKNTLTVSKIPSTVDYILGLSKSYAPIENPMLGEEMNSKKIVYLGFPVFDVLHSNNESELKKIVGEKKYKKVILWMPTFRKGIGKKRNDYSIEQTLGIPLINTKEEYKSLNEELKKFETLLIIKIHPMQDPNVLKIDDLSNIIVLTGEDVKKIDVDNYRLMSCVDALISDYSGAAYDFLQLDRPIAYVLSDMEYCKLGFVVEDIHQLIAGNEIYTYEDLISFVGDVYNNKDIYKEKRRYIAKFIHTYFDTNNCARIAKFLGIEK